MKPFLDLLPTFKGFGFITLVFSWGIVIAQGVPTAPSGLSATVISANSVEFAWVDNSGNETGFTLEKSLQANSGFEPFAVVAANTTRMIVGNLTPATTYFVRMNSLNNSGASNYSNVVSFTTDSEGNLPDFWDFTNVGDLNTPGSAVYEGGFYKFQAQGFFDGNFSMMHMPLNGDGGIVARFFDQRRDNGSNNGVAILENVEAKPVFAMNLLNKQSNNRYFGRSAEGGELEELSLSTSFQVPVWLRIERSGNTFITSSSEDGENWVESHRKTIAMAQDASIGILGFSGNNDNWISLATLEDVYVFHPNNKLATPTNFTTTLNQNNHVVLNWDDVSTNETGFKIERATKISIRDEDLGRSAFVEIAELPANTTTYTDADLEPKAKYLYRIKAADGQIVSLPSATQSIGVADMPNLTFWMERLIGDYDRSNFNNTIVVNKTADTINNRMRHPGMIGKSIDVNLESALNSADGSIALKIMPDTHDQTVEFFSSASFSMTQVGSDLMIDANGVQTTFDVLLDSVVCNNIVLRFKNGTMSPYINGQWLADVNVGSFTINAFALETFEGNIWDIRFIQGQISDSDVASLSARCTSGVEPQDSPWENFPHRICGVYLCTWIREEQEISAERNRAFHYSLDGIYDVNTFDVEMYEQPDLEFWMNSERNGRAVKFNNVTYQQFDENGINSYWLHENFHSYQAVLFTFGRWLAESTANWATWNFRKAKGGAGISQYTLNPQYGLIEALPDDTGGAPGRYYHACVFWLYVTEYVSDPSLIGELYNTPELSLDPVNVIARTMRERGHDFKEVFAEFAARTAVWDYPDAELSAALKRSEKSAIAQGEEDNRLVKNFDREGTFGVIHPVPEFHVPGPFSWNTYRIGTTTASKYTIKLKGHADNPEDADLLGKIIRGTEGAYTYTDLIVSSDVTFGDGEASIQVDANEGEELYLVVVSGSTTFRTDPTERTRYSYSIESDAHLITEDHIRRFILEEQTGDAVIDHYDFTVNIEVQRGTDVTKLTPTIEIAEGSTISPASNEEVDFTDPVVYTVTDASGNSKEWTVTVALVPPLTGNDILTFELEEVPFAIIDKETLTIEVNLIAEDIDLTAVTPIFTISEDATSAPASGETIDLTGPVIIAVTAENGVTKRWTLITDQFSPFITTWGTTSDNEEVNINLRADSDFNYVWKSESGDEIERGSVNSETQAVFSTSLPSAGLYSLEITGVLGGWDYDRDQLKDVNQWGDNPWTNWFNIFRGWKGERFSATDVPNLNKVESMNSAFRSATNFNDDLSRWDVSNVTSMLDAFNNANAFDGDLNDWDVTNVTNIDGMFESSRDFSTDLGKWNLKNLESIRRVFKFTNKFDQQIGSWNIEKITSLEETLRDANLSVVNYDLTLAGWASQNVKEEVELGADGLQYCNAKEARDYLVNVKGWNIIDDGYNCEGVQQNIILTFELEGQKEFASIDPNDYTVTVEMNSDTDFSSLIPSITISSGATISPASEVAQDFTNPVTYTVTSAEGISQDWVVSLTKASTEANILTFMIGEEIGSATINEEEHTITIKMQSETNDKLFAPIITVSDGASVSPRSGIAQNFTNPVTYTVIAEDNLTAQDWVVAVLKNELTDVQNVMSLNGDGINDTWIIDPFLGMEEAEIKVFNKAGVVVFSSVGYETPWEGKYKGTLLPAGVYYYFISSPSVKKSGYILLTR